MTIALLTFGSYSRTQMRTFVFLRIELPLSWAVKYALALKLAIDWWLKIWLWFVINTALEQTNLFMVVILWTFAITKLLSDEEGFVPFYTPVSRFLFFPCSFIAFKSVICLTRLLFGFNKSLWWSYPPSPYGTPPLLALLCALSLCHFLLPVLYFSSPAS